MTLSAFLSVIVLVPIGFVILYVLSIFLKYRKSSYKDASGNSFLQILFAKGNYGEFLITSRLKKLEMYDRLLTNVYLRKSDGSTTEIDILMIAETGIYVFESKNYSGWIFGDEKGRNWTQVLENKQKNHFYNPVWQNNGHITALKHATGLGNPELYRSYIVFSERCTLKKVTVDSHNVFVMKRDSLLRNVKLDMMSSPNVFDSEQVDRIYVKLLGFTHADSYTKSAHIENVRSKIS